MNYINNTLSIQNVPLAYKYLAEFLDDLAFANATSITFYDMADMG